MPRRDHGRVRPLPPRRPRPDPDPMAVRTGETAAACEGGRLGRVWSRRSERCVRHSMPSVHGRGQHRRPNFTRIRPTSSVFANIGDIGSKSPGRTDSPCPADCPPTRRARRSVGVPHASYRLRRLIVFTSGKVLQLCGDVVGEVVVNSAARLNRCLSKLAQRPQIARMLPEFGQCLADLDQKGPSLVRCPMSRRRRPNLGVRPTSARRPPNLARRWPNLCESSRVWTNSGNSLAKLGRCRPNAVRFGLLGPDSANLGRARPNAV